MYARCARTIRALAAELGRYALTKYLALLITVPRRSLRAPLSYLLAGPAVTLAAILLTALGAVALDLTTPARHQVWLEPLLVLGAPVVCAAVVFSLLALRLQRRGLFHPGVPPHLFRAGPLYLVATLLALYYWIAHTYSDFWMVRHLLVVSFLVAVTGVLIDAFVARISTRGPRPEPETLDLRASQGYTTPPTVPWREEHDPTA